MLGGERGLFVLSGTLVDVRPEARIALALVALIAGGCAALLQLDEVIYEGSDAASDAIADSATGGDGGDAGSSLDANVDAPIFHPIDQPGFWSFSDVYAPDGSDYGYGSAVFDGSYLYLVPSVGGVVVRYKTGSDFGATGVWESFDTNVVADGGGTSPQFSGAAFDGRYVYFAPNLNGQSGVVRFDSWFPFTAASSWQTFYMETLDTNLKGYRGAAFRDPYVYFIPSYGVDAHDHGNVVRFDKNKTFTDPASWEHTDVKAALGVEARGFAGAVVASDALYLVPGSLSAGGVANQVARFDFRPQFSADAGGWSLSSPNATGFFGGVYDGRFVYLAPCCMDEFDPLVGKYAVRVDTQSDAGWTRFNSSTLDLPLPASSGAAFDGRRVYFVPHELRTGPAVTQSGVVTSYDTTGSFVTKTGWTQFDLVQIDARAKYFQSAAFDGRYVYFLPAAANGRIARFDARQPQAKFDVSFASFF